MTNANFLKPATHTQTIKPSYIREILAATNQQGMISLAGGLPDADLFPMQIIVPAMDEIKHDSSLFQYSSTQGHKDLLDLIRQKFMTNPNHDALICTGSQQALDLIARAYINPGDHIVMEAPSYLGALQVFELAQANIHCVEQQTNQEKGTGPNIEALEKIFKSQTIKFFYAVPDFHNPTGVCWSKHTREQVAKLCRKYQVCFIEDAPYRELRFKGEMLDEMAHLYEHTISLKSFSKIATPGIRLGAVMAAPEIIQNLIKIKQTSDLHSSIPMQALLVKLLSHEDFDEHFQKLKAHYKTKHDIMFNSIQKHLTDDTVINDVQGGMFLWLETPSIHPTKIETAARALLKNNIAVVPSNVFYPESFPIEHQQSGFRLNFTHASPEQIEQGILKIKQVLSEFSNR